MKIKITDVGQHDWLYRHKNHFIGSVGELLMCHDYGHKWAQGTVVFDKPVEFSYRKTKSSEKVGPIRQAYFQEFKFEVL